MGNAVVRDSLWIVPTFLLFIVAFHNFNEPPTNRPSTTFFLFVFGAIIYYAMLLVIWVILVAIVESAGVEIFGIKIGSQSVDAQRIIEFTAPLIAALLVLVGGYLKIIKQLDKRARSYCIKLAYIPREADRLTQELAQHTPYNRNDGIASILLPELMSRENINNRSEPSSLATRLSSAREHFSSAMYLYSIVCMKPLQNGSRKQLYPDLLGPKYRAHLAVDKVRVDKANAKYESLVILLRHSFCATAF